MANAIKDEWTEEKCLQLIREFRARPILWDQKDPFFFKKAVKPNAWQEISDIVNICPDKCKHKMIILMSSFRREKAKILHSVMETGDPSQAYKSSWFAFKHLAFLMDKENERKRQLNGTEDDEDDDDCNSFKSTLLRSHIDTQTTPKPMKKNRRLSMSLPKELHQKVVESIREEIPLTPPSIPTSLPPPVPSQTAAERDEEIKSFTSFIGNKMKKYSDTTKNTVQQAICDIIFKADQNCYEPNRFDKFTIIDDATDPFNRALYDIQDCGAVIKVQNYSDTD